MQERVPDSLKQCRDGREQRFSKTCVSRKLSIKLNMQLQFSGIIYTI